jgi:hypothetical protein
MKQAGINVVRMGESTWSLLEPEDGKVDFDWMDRTIAGMQKAGTEVILGTPTYSLPPGCIGNIPRFLPTRSVELPCSMARARIWIRIIPLIVLMQNVSSRHWSSTIAIIQR